ncbi:MAG: 16S rRNA (guanine(966)-N(2))-methyltransferase RsmD [Geminicoccaceae bacterium]|nr:16S rRNA (guanine(966)-N(2))-methyltransferase RsmD [Geminicoccaceae bacterium]MCX7630724.1 16S rRNA (guanine(966)-N(2))-methyltransferase RsmD [Geminicoccaceae bacterium]MDW8123636.1 16S rRNA (guanine(966)-N(2))-methyltransferase RsmD [Geminicoccaceae bacterium]
MRIIAGRHRGRKIQAPPGLSVRPTADRAREALMAILEHGAPPLAGSRFLDLFAGSGAVGLEAASRGAAAVLLVENAPEAIAAIRRNIEHLGEGERVRLLVADATRLGPARESFDIVFLDPPWRSGLAEPALEALLEGGWIAPGARIVVELARDEVFEPPSGFAIEQERRYGKTRFLFLRLAQTPRSATGGERSRRTGHRRTRPNPLPSAPSPRICAPRGRVPERC